MAFSTPVARRSGCAIAVAPSPAAVIESVAMVDESLRDRAFGSVWPAVWSVRNRIAHGYFHVDRTIITATVENDLGEFEQGLDRIEADLTG